MSIGVTFDLRDLEAHGRKLGAVAERQLPFALAKTLTQTAKQAASKDVPDGMKSAFHEPTRYTLNVFGIIPATKQKLRAEILPRAFAGKGNVAWDYLDPEVAGGPRKAKRSERRLSAVLGSKVYLVPARGAKLDKHGNMPRSQWTKVISGLGALGDQSATAKSAKRNSKRKIANHGKKARSQYFVGRGRSTKTRTSLAKGKPIAIYEVKRRGVVEPVMLITTRQPGYRPRFAFGPVVERSVKQHMPALFERNLAEAIRTDKSLMML